MSVGFDEVYVDTRRQLRGVAARPIAGPRYRAARTIRLAVRPDGFAGVVIPLAVHTMSAHSRRTSPSSSDRAEGNL